MSSILGHGLAGLAAYQVVQRPARLPGGAFGVGLALALALLPDLDVLGMVLWPGRFYHRGFSHSLLFAAGLAAAAGGLLSLDHWRRFPRLWAGLLVVCLVHPLLDFFMAGGPGVPLFWPWDLNSFHAPVPLLPTAYYSHSWRGLASLLTHGPTLRGMALELAIFGPLLLLALWLRRSRPPCPGQRAPGQKT